MGDLARGHGRSDERLRGPPAVSGTFDRDDDSEEDTVTATTSGLWGVATLRVDADQDQTASTRTAGAQASADSSSRLRVRLGSSGMPGPIVVARVAFLT